MLKHVSSIIQMRALIIVFVVSVQFNTATAEETQLSDDFAMVMRPPDASIEIDESEAQNIANFFHQAERAIQSENINELMALYSDEYTNQKSGDKQFAAELWGKIFSRFDNISSRHSMKLIDYDQAAGRAITECSGLLFGTPEGESNPVLIDRWDDQRHILLKEGDWKLLGNSGETALRYGEKDEKLHPLF
jgi:hypothetical protein